MGNGDIMPYTSTLDIVEQNNSNLNCFPLSFAYCPSIRLIRDILKGETRCLIKMISNCFSYGEWVVKGVLLASKMRVWINSLSRSFAAIMKLVSERNMKSGCSH
ncbi:hypothetical protein CEXT_581981 [Caerostris extrusa]|uniref:Uncharacterized protein n=1 Tax=Caerostris extrusa TaxID=172846 RepID=A0AAV4MDM7_CAEEX|nr:hypothetical protein CEXT_581981 [Caerostris extrusa]